MKKLQQLRKIYQNLLSQESKKLINLQYQQKKIKFSLDEQYNLDSQHYIDIAHLKAQKSREELGKIEEEIRKEQLAIKEKFFEKKKIETALDNYTKSEKKRLVKEEIVKDDNLAIINCRTKNLIE